MSNEASDVGDVVGDVETLETKPTGIKFLDEDFRKFIEETSRDVIMNFPRSKLSPEYAAELDREKEKLLSKGLVEWLNSS